MFKEEILEYELARRGKYGSLVEGQEVLTETPPMSKFWWRYMENYQLDIKS